MRPEPFFRKVTSLTILAPEYNHSDLTPVKIAVLRLCRHQQGLINYFSGNASDGESSHYEIESDSLIACSNESKHRFTARIPDLVWRVAFWSSCLSYS